MSNKLRNIKRKKDKKIKKDIQEKMFMFDKIGDHCETCQQPFDKTDREQVSSWNVVVKEEQGVVRLYCPQCWDKALNIINDFKKRVEARNDS
jgi:Zn finger protein HypA/HybF involved in hydrogenase expression